MTGWRRLSGGFFGAALLVAGAMFLIRDGTYGWTLFLLIPVLAGALASWMLQPATEAGAAATGALTAMLALTAVLALAIDGLICIAMAVPLAVPLGALGGWMAYQLRAKALAKQASIVLLIVPPMTFAWDTKAQPEVFAVRTSIVVDASPERVWRRVVQFSEIAPPQDWLFHTGLAYPVRARIIGTGPGAIRYCEFSTGAFVEPIEVWNEPQLLRFRVTENPPPLEEWNPFGHVRAKHLHGYLISKRGQFRLVPLPNGRTLLEGTTWYQHGLWPAEYWRWWSDAIIHRIHLRVLNHVRALAEQPRG